MCIFCKIVNGEIPCYKVYEDDHFLAFLDISQATRGHTLVIPKKHISNIFELDEEYARNMMNVIAKTAKILQNKLGITSVNLLNNSGKLAGQTVDHFHVHIIPRYQNDDCKFDFTEHEFNAENLQKLYETINN